MSKSVLSCMIKWFAANYLVLNLDKTNIMKFITNNSPNSALCIGYKGKYIEETVNTIFLGLQIDNCLNWKNHTEQMISVSGACYAVRSMFRISTITTLKSTSFIYVHSIIKYRIIFWGNSSNSGENIHFTNKQTNKQKTPELQFVHIPELHVVVYLKKLEILPTPHQYILSLMNFIVNNKETFQTNSSIHNIKTWNMHHLHRPNANLF